jgi:hypothetical protein
MVFCCDNRSCGEVTGSKLWPSSLLIGQTAPVEAYIPYVATFSAHCRRLPLIWVPQGSERMRPLIPICDILSYRRIAGDWVGLVAAGKLYLHYPVVRIDVRILNKGRSVDQKCLLSP